MPITITRIPSPEDWRAKQVGNLKAVGEANYRAKIVKPKKDPILAGIEAEAKYANEMRRVIETKAREAGLRATSADEWLSYAESIGAGRLVEGVTKREPKIAKFLNKWQPLLKSHVDKLDTMPNATLAERKAKMLANVDGLVALHGAAKKS
jgi:hypothetical protein